MSLTDRGLRVPLSEDFEGNGDVSMGGDDGADEFLQPYLTRTASSSKSQHTCKDALFAALYLVHVVVILALALVRGVPAVARGGVREVEAGSGEEVDDMDPVPSILALGVILVVGAFASAASLKALLQMGEGMIRFSILSSAGLMLVSAFSLAVAGHVSPSLIPLFGGLILLLYYRLVRSRIAFAGCNLKVACTAVSALPSTGVAAFTLMAAQAVWGFLWGLAVLGVATNYSDAFVVSPDGTKYAVGSCVTYVDEPVQEGGSFAYSCECGGTMVFTDQPCQSYSVNALVYTLLVFSLLWGGSVMSNLSHCTTAGAVGTWWFRRDPGETPVRDSFRRAVTTSFGTVCVASLVLAGAKLLRILVGAARSQAERSNRSSLLVVAVLACIDCLVSALERIVQIFSRYALCHVSLYGTSFLEAGRATAELFSKRGWTAIINDDLIGNALALSCMVVASACALTGWGLGHMMGLSNPLTLVLALFGLFAGFTMSSVATAVISSAVATVFVCWAQDEAAFASTHPQLWSELMTSWHEAHGDVMVACGYALA
jgi:hypothetical protein